MSEKKSAIFQKDLNQYSNVKHVIAIVSGKGGVGKSLVTSMLAVMMQRKGYKTAILDADITGPSIPKTFGVSGQTYATTKGISPAKTKSGIQIMSLNLLLDEDTKPAIWRGPVIAGMVEQFWTDVYWEDVDYMFVDMPPGTGDVPLTVFQSLPVDSVVVVTSPQELVGMIVEKAVNMANMMDIPVHAIVENMSYFICPTCGNRHKIFGDSHIEETAKKFDIDTLCKLPIDSGIAKAVDAGLIEMIYHNELMPIINKLLEENES